MTTSSSYSKSSEVGIPQLDQDPTPAGVIQVWFNVSEGALKKWDGTQVVVYDIDEGEVTDAFGTGIGVDV